MTVIKQITSINQTTLRIRSSQPSQLIGSPMLRSLEVVILQGQLKQIEDQSKIRSDLFTNSEPRGEREERRRELNSPKKGVEDASSTEAHPPDSISRDSGNSIHGQAAAWMQARQRSRKRRPRGRDADRGLIVLQNCILAIKGRSGGSLDANDRRREGEIFKP